MIKVKNIHNGNEVYFRFFSDKIYPRQFWYTKTTDNFGFELAFISSYEPLNKTWKEIKDEKI